MDSMQCQPARPVRQYYTPIRRKAHIGDGSFNAKPPEERDLDLIAGQVTSGHDPRLAYAFSIISGWSYSDGQTLANKLEWYGLEDNIVYEFAIVNPGILVCSKAFFVRSKTGRVGVLSFCGTEPDSVIDLLTDANVSFKMFGPEAAERAVHTGFFDSVEVLWEDVSERLELARRGEPDEGQQKPAPLETLYVTGHSLGGAMAVLAAATILKSAKWKSIVRGVYTYGQPAVGDANFASHFAEELKGRYFRHVNGSDVVPHMPPKECGSYCHFGSELTWNASEAKWSGAAEKVKALQSRIATALPLVGISFLARRLPRLAWMTRWPLPWPLSYAYSIDDHSPIQYMDKCRTALRTFERERLRVRATAGAPTPAVAGRLASSRGAVVRG